MLIKGIRRRRMIDIAKILRETIQRDDRAIAAGKIGTSDPPIVTLTGDVREAFETLLEHYQSLLALTGE